MQLGQRYLPQLLRRTAALAARNPVPTHTTTRRQLAGAPLAGSLFGWRSHLTATRCNRCRTRSGPFNWRVTVLTKQRVPNSGHRAASRARPAAGSVSLEGLSLAASQQGSHSRAVGRGSAPCGEVVVDDRRTGATSRGRTDRRACWRQAAQGLACQPTTRWSRRASADALQERWASPQPPRSCARHGGSHAGSCGSSGGSTRSIGHTQLELFLIPGAPWCYRSLSHLIPPQQQGRRGPQRRRRFSRCVPRVSASARRLHGSQEPPRSLLEAVAAMSAHPKEGDCARSAGWALGLSPRSPAAPASARGRVTRRRPSAAAQPPSSRAAAS